MNRLGRTVLNSPARAAAQRRFVVPALGRLGGDLDGCRVLEIGCGGGFGAGLLLELLRAGDVDAIDIDPVMVRLARRRLGDRVDVRVGDIVEISAPPESYDAVVDMGAIHLEPRWRDAVRRRPAC
jgi:SAM-dependent methyltransferase